MILIRQRGNTNWTGDANVHVIVVCRSSAAVFIESVWPTGDKLSVGQFLRISGKCDFYVRFEGKVWNLTFFNIIMSC